MSARKRDIKTVDRSGGISNNKDTVKPFQGKAGPLRQSKALKHNAEIIVGYSRQP
ncbi:MAG: hypothetical protein HDS50_01160 [Bacteroides sp.]|nr:hypothetical protein [Bacteroides sp.]